MEMTEINDAAHLAVNIFENRKQMGIHAAEVASERINALLLAQPVVNVIFAAAPSQNEFLEELITLDIDWSRINAFHMDEYIGLDEAAPQGFGNFLSSRLFEKVPFKTVNYLRDVAYSDLLDQFPVDVVCMGIGENGHIAFNDPPVADFADAKAVKIVELDLVCRQQQVNDGCFKSIEEVPTHAVTLTIPALLKAKHIICVVPGLTKAQAVWNTLNEDISTEYPSTILRNHPDVSLFLDQDSSSLLK
ncbi:glucosamine-6-phosphate deaminase [Pedobacter sp. MC2016-14]|uniref:glucosamine-6-phosphate deaminase n=1 Tax=Pedobacter sp. MC2016-14 TaxID=2897327 RepID=UPI001E53C00B|nr:glucosamine-6-phosphate deaminase [Pedobacter sp. MC2016-14]MCD0487497.1 glucosamine-6-phosphate deaminase [Pedobacter sp. MC2016-14]